MNKKLVANLLVKIAKSLSAEEKEHKFKSTPEQINIMMRNMPSGTKFSEYSGVLSWSKSGGYAGEGAIKRTVEKFERLGFKKKDSSSSDTPDGSVANRGRWYENKNGDRLEVSSRYGVDRYDNGYNISVKLAPNDKELAKQDEKKKYKENTPIWKKENETLIKEYLTSRGFKIDKVEGGSSQDSHTITVHAFYNVKGKKPIECRFMLTHEWSFKDDSTTLKAMVSMDLKRDLYDLESTGGMKLDASKQEIFSAFDENFKKLAKKHIKASMSESPKSLTAKDIKGIVHRITADVDLKGMTMDKETASEGAKLADKLADADRLAENLSNKIVDLEFSKRKKDRILAPKAKEDAKKAQQEYNKIHAETEAFQKKNGVTVIQAWEAYHDKGWNRYTVWSQGSNDRFKVAKNVSATFKIEKEIWDASRAVNGRLKCSLEMAITDHTITLEELNHETDILKKQYNADRLALKKSDIINEVESISGMYLKAKSDKIIISINFDVRPISSDKLEKAIALLKKLEYNSDVEIDPERFTDGDHD